MFGFGSKKKATTNAQPSVVPPGQQPGAGAARNQAQAGAVLRTDADADTKPDLADYLATHKDTVVEQLVTAAGKRLIANVEAKMGKILAAKKAEILANAQAEMKKTVGAQSHGADLNAGKLLGESFAWTNVEGMAHAKAEALVDPHTAGLTAVGDAAFAYDPEGELKKSQRAKHLEKVTAKARAAIDDEAKKLELTLTAETAKESTKTSLITSAQTTADTTLKEDATEDLKQRDANNQKIEDAVDKPVDAVGKEIRETEQGKLEKGLGARGTVWFQGAEFKAFHTKMKAAAREKGHEETDKAIAAKRAAGGGAAGHKAEFEHQTVQAHALTHKEAKIELRAVMKTLATELLTKADEEVKTTEKLKAAGTAAGWNALRDDPASPKAEAAAVKAATAAIKGAKATVEGELHTKATLLKDAYVKKGDEVEAGQAQSKNQALIDTKVKDRFEDDTGGKSFGRRMMTQALEAPTASKGLERVSKLIDAACPQPGDETELQVELKIPATHGAFCYLTVTGNAARSKHMELGIDIAFGAGWETWGLSARGGFNVFLKAGAADTTTAMQMIHYGAYRNLTGVSTSAASFWTGAIDPGKTGTGDKQVGKTEQAELWAAMTEERAFGADPKAFVEVGGGVGGSAKLNAGITGEVSGRATSALRWDKEVLDKAGGAGKFGDRENKSREERKQLAQTKRGDVSKHAKRVNKFKFGTSIEAEAGGQKFSLGLEAERTAQAVGADWAIQIAGGIPYDGANANSSTLFSKIAASYVPAALGGVKKIYDAYKAKNPTAGETEGGGDDVARGVGGVADAGEDLLVGLDAGGMTNNLMKSLADANPQNLEATHAEGVNDTARLWLGGDVGMKGAMGDAGDMSKATSAVPNAAPFGASSQLQVLCIIEIPEGGQPKVTFKVMKSKEMKMGGDLGAGVGLTGKLTRKQELAGFSVEKGGPSTAWMGGRS